MGQEAGFTVSEVSLRGADGAAVPCFVAEPAGVPNAPGVVIVPEIFGLSAWIRDSARRLAGFGFRAAAVEQIKIWGTRLNVPVIAGAYGADPAAIAHDAVVAAQSRHADYLFIDTAGRLHTKQNLMQELQKVHRVMGRQAPGAPHEMLLVLDATTGMNALNQAREFNKAVGLTGLVVTKLDGTSKGGIVVAIQQELGLPVKFVGLGEQPDDLQPFDAKQFAEALMS